MPRDKTESHNRLIRVAKEEFLEKGFLHASMREIAKRAGLTQGAIYRHYESKEAMFSALVDPFIEEVMRDANMHEERAYSNFDSTKNSEAMMGDNVVELMKRLIVSRHDELRLLISKSNGTKYEGFINDLVTMEVDGTLKAFKYLKANGIRVKDVDRDEMHVLLTSYMSAILEPIAHDWPVEKAIKCLDLVEEFFIPAWGELMGFKKEENDEK